MVSVRCSLPAAPSAPARSCGDHPLHLILADQPLGEPAFGAKASLTQRRKGQSTALRESAQVYAVDAMRADHLGVEGADYPLSDGTRENEVGMSFGGLLGCRDLAPERTVAACRVAHLTDTVVRGPAQPRGKMATVEFECCHGVEEPRHQLGVAVGDLLGAAAVVAREPGGHPPQTGQEDAGEGDLPAVIAAAGPPHELGADGIASGPARRFFPEHRGQTVEPHSTGRQAVAEEAGLEFRWMRASDHAGEFGGQEVERCRRSVFECHRDRSSVGSVRTASRNRPRSTSWAVRQVPVICPRVQSIGRWAGLGHCLSQRTAAGAATWREASGGELPRLSAPPRQRIPATARSRPS